MQHNRLSAYGVLIMLVAMIPLTGVDCDETGDFLRGTESRTFAAVVADQISSGIITALACEFSGRLVFGNAEDAGLRACDPTYDASASTTETTE